jgi:hypothetical protein
LGSSEDHQAIIVLIFHWYYFPLVWFRAWSCPLSSNEFCAAWGKQKSHTYSLSFSEGVIIFCSLNRKRCWDTFVGRKQKLCCLLQLYLGGYWQNPGSMNQAQLWLFFISVATPSLGKAALETNGQYGHTDVKIKKRSLFYMIFFFLP